jgi:hypothetical protein
MSSRVINQMLGEGMDDADDGSELRVSGPAQVQNQAAATADDIVNAAEYLASLINREPNGNNPKIAKNLEQILMAMNEMIELVGG